MEKGNGVFKILEMYEEIKKETESPDTRIFIKIEDALGNERFLRNAKIDKKNKIIYGLDEKMKGSLVAINFSSIYDGRIYGHSSTSSTCFF